MPSARWADYLGALLASAGGGILLAVVSAMGWLGTKLPVPVVIGGGIVIGVTAGVVLSRRKTSTSEFTPNRRTPAD